MGLKGDLSELRKLYGKFQRHGELRTKLIESAAKAALSQVKAGFAASKDPYGAQWQPVRYRRGKPLVKTGKLRGSYQVHLTSRGFVITTNVDYAPYHQFGTTRMVARPMVSDPDNMSVRWGMLIRAAAEEAWRRFWSK